MKFYRNFLMVVLLLLTGPVFAQRTITIKMASIVPENTPWGHFLNRIASEWKRITDGQVNVIVYHNGTAGKEDEIIRSLNLNQMQAGVLSTFGLTEIAPEVMTLSCPFFIRNDDELDKVFNEIKPELEDRINAKGFFTLAWARVGWVKIFSKAPVFMPSDLKNQKLATNGEYEKLNQAFKTMGFQMIPVAQDDILVALNSPMVDAVYSSPIAVGGTQIFGLAKNMASINIAPFMGAVIINRPTWRAVPEKFKASMIEAVRREELELDKTVRKFEEGMIKTMGNYGLKVNQLTPAQEQLWYDEIERAMPGMIGTFFDRIFYNRIQAILREQRNRLRG
ncbi:MAG: TRAP transporter substrate-binding protein DctP [Treponema sp.]|nr:TRAP transporter substrate-binding protein DctP [Treponema sp.]